MNNRYSRQTLVPQLGQDSQAQITKAKVLIVGAGGLGCTVATQLSGAGVGYLNIIDHDTIDLSNLHRQILFREADVGASKAAVCAREVKRINSECSVSALEQRLSTANISQLVGAVDIVVDAADNFATSYLLSDACLEQAKPLVSASVNRTFGYVGQFCFNSPSLRAVFPRLPLQQASCDSVGVTGPSVGVIASIQAQEVLKCIVQDASQLRGKLLYIDAWNYSQQLIDFNSTAEPSGAILNLVSASSVSADYLVIDVREALEIEQAPLNFERTQHIPVEQIASAQQSISTDTPIVCACRSGQRAISAAQQLINLGYTEVSALIPE